MGSMTAAELRTELWFALDNKTTLDPTDGTNAVRLNRWLNWAYDHITDPRIYKHQVLKATQSITLVTSTQTYSLASDLWGIRWVYYTDTNSNPKRVTPRTQQQLDRVRAGSGAPTFYAREGNSINLQESPTSTENGETLTVRYWKEPTALAFSATVIPRRFDPILLEFATAYAWKALGQLEKADTAFALAAALLNDVGEVEDLESEGNEDWEMSINLELHQRMATHA